MKSYKLTLADAQHLALYMGVRWSELEGAELEHAASMRFHNVVKQRKVGDRVELRASYAEQWERLIKAVPADAQPRPQDIDADDAAGFDVPVRDDESPAPDFNFRNEGSLVILNPVSKKTSPSVALQKTESVFGR
jgi:hypothetical protein